MHFLPYNCFSRLLKSFRTNETLFYTNQGVKVIETQDLRILDTRKYIRGLSIERELRGYRGAIEFSIHTCIFLERNKHEWLSFM